MKLNELSLHHFRNFTDYTLEPSEKFNLLVADNGGGKTSLLEAIYFLGMGRSFRTSDVDSLVQHGKEKFQLVGKFNKNDIVVGIERPLGSQPSRIRINGQEARSLAELAQHFPLQLIHHENFHLLDAGPQYRREFLDWGGFYTEPLYFGVWQKYQRALKQRNALLKNPDDAQLDFWEQELSIHAITLDRFRQRYLTLFIPLLEETLHPLLLDGISIQYSPGWDNDRHYQVLLQRTRQRDTLLGYTQYGPHRADLKIKIHQHDADHFLSRGQQKMLSFALRTTQALLLSRMETPKTCLFLIDDLAAELDPKHIQKSFDILETLPSQVFITTIHASLFEKQLSHDNLSLFHVDQSGLI